MLRSEYHAAIPGSIRISHVSGQPGPEAFPHAAYGNSGSLGAVSVGASRIGAGLWGSAVLHRVERVRELGGDVGAGFGSTGTGRDRGADDGALPGPASGRGAVAGCDCLRRDARGNRVLPAGGAHRSGSPEHRQQPALYRYGGDAGGNSGFRSGVGGRAARLGTGRPVAGTSVCRAVGDGEGRAAQSPEVASVTLSQRGTASAAEE